MAITTIDGIIAGAQPPRYFCKAISASLVAGRPFVPWHLAGIPGIRTAPSAGVNGANLTASDEAIKFVNPVSGNSYLTRFSADITQQCTVLLVDLLWENSGLSVTSLTAQAITQPTLEPRDRTGTTNGDSVLIGLRILTATGGGANVPQITYTNSVGTTGKTANPAFAYAATSTTGSFYPFALAAGDLGVRSVTSYINSASMTSGTISLVAYRVLAVIDVGAYSGASAGPVDLGFPQLYDDTVPNIIIIPSATTASIISGMMSVAQG
jgi:hypothetical protein